MIIDPPFGVCFMKITLTAYDYMRLRGYAGPAVFIDRDTFLRRGLAELLDDANIVSPLEISSDVVTMNSKVEFKDLYTREDMIVSLVFPPDAGNNENRLSILSPKGLLLLGSKAGQEVEGRIKVARLLYQPEASGHFHL
jgi:regulator of nucleoside diphosphate kinase